MKCSGPLPKKKKGIVETLNPNGVWKRTGASNLVSKHNYKD